MRIRMNTCEYASQLDSRCSKIPAEEPEVGGALLLVGVAAQRVREGVRVRDRDGGQRAHAVGRAGGGLPGDGGTPVVADDVHPLGAERVGEAHDVGGQRCARVGLDALRPSARRVAAQVGRHGAVAGLGEPPGDRAPRSPRLREAVQQQHDAPVGGPGGLCVERESRGLQREGLHAHPVSALARTTPLSRSTAVSNSGSVRWLKDRRSSLRPSPST